MPQVAPSWLAGHVPSSTPDQFTLGWIRTPGSRRPGAVTRSRPIPAERDPVFPSLFTPGATDGMGSPGRPLVTLTGRRTGREFAVRLVDHQPAASARASRDLTVTVTDTGTGLTLSALSFSLARSGGHDGILVTGLRTDSDPRARGLVRDATREMHGLRPKALAFWCVQQLAALWQVRGITAATQPDRPAGPDQFWRECDGRRLPDGGWELPLRMAVRSRAELKPNRRSMYQQRYQMLEQTRPGLLAAALALVPAGSARLEAGRNRLAPAATASLRVKLGSVTVVPSRTLPVLVINLDRSAGRLDRIRSRLAGLGLPFHRLPAVDGNTLSDSAHNFHYSAELNRRCYHKPLVPGEIGCYLSHLRAWQWMLDHPCKGAVILEDDVILGDNFPEALDLLPRIGEPWDVIKLGSLSAKPVLHATPLGPFSLRRYRKTPISAFAQAVSRRGAEKLLRTRAAFGRPVDVDLQHVWENGLEVLGLEPHPVTVRPGEDSEICRSLQRKKVRCNRLAFFRQRLQFAAHQWRHNLGWYGWRLHDLLTPRSDGTAHPPLATLDFNPK